MIHYIIFIEILLNFGLLVLIWMIQLIVYPSFLYYNTKSLVIWHKLYTSRFSFIVIPLMLSQLFISFYQLIAVTNLYTVISFVTILLIWASTFLQFVPIHFNISKGIVDEKVLISLVKKNWIRTILWTFLFIYSISNYFI
jgi:hypothetical protein